MLAAEEIQSNTLGKNVPDPTFLLIGAQKSGTTWMSVMLAQHPDVFIPKQKELHFFNITYNYNKGIEWYRNQFSEYSGESAIGECTPNYLWVCNAPNTLKVERDAPGEPEIVFQEYPYLIRNIPELVYKHFPALKFIICMRNPVERAISSFYHAIRKRRISPNSRILKIGGQQGIVGMGFYYRHLLEWLKYFPKERFLYLIYEEDILENKLDTIRKIFKHIEVDNSFIPQNMELVYNKHPSQIFMFLNYYFPSFAKRLFNLIPYLEKFNPSIIKIAESDIRQLHRLYKEENKLLERLIDRSLAVWRSNY